MRRKSQRALSSYSSEDVLSCDEDANEKTCMPMNDVSDLSDLSAEEEVTRPSKSRLRNRPEKSMNLRSKRIST